MAVEVNALKRQHECSRLTSVRFSYKIEASANTNGYSCECFLDGPLPRRARCGCPEYLDNPLSNELNVASAMLLG